MSKPKLVCADIELAVANFFGYRENIIIPNISWGFNLGHEADLVILRPSGWLMEVEIKTSASDIKRDLLKQAPHRSRRWLTTNKNESNFHWGPLIQRCYFAVPESLATDPNIPDYCGIISISDWQCKIVKPAPLNKNSRKLNDAEIKKLLRLATMRTWTLKTALQRLRNKSHGT